MSWFIRRTASLAARSAAFEKFISLLEYADGKIPGLLRVLTYHRVDDPGSRPWLYPGLISATPGGFRMQMEHLARHYNPVSIRDVVNAVQTGDVHTLPPRAVLVTFDDAYCDFEENAWPVLKRLGIPVTIFVPTAFPDRPMQTFWWDDLYNAIRLTSRKDLQGLPIDHLPVMGPSRDQNYVLLKNHIKTLEHMEAMSVVRKLCIELDVSLEKNSVLGWDALRKLSGEGVVLGAHTRTHPLMHRIPVAEAREEVAGSIQDLKREIGWTPPVFAYPSGEFSDEVVSMLPSAGVTLAFTTQRGINNLKHAHLLKARRINVGGNLTLPILRAQLLSWTVHFNWLQNLMKV